MLFYLFIFKIFHVPKSYFSANDRYKIEDLFRKISHEELFNLKSIFSYDSSQTYCDVKFIKLI